MLLRYYSEREKKQREGKDKYKERKKIQRGKINRKREYIMQINILRYGDRYVQRNRQIVT